MKAAPVVLTRWPTSTLSTYRAKLLFAKHLRMDQTATRGLRPQATALTGLSALPETAEKMPSVLGSDSSPVASDLGLTEPSTSLEKSGSPPKVGRRNRANVSKANASRSPASAAPGYIFENGLRRVPPYHFTYKTWCKERWRGLQLINIYEREFRDRPVDYYRKSIELGLVTVNWKTVGPNYVVKNGDLISNALHRHEPPVTVDPVVVLHEDDEMVVINKPAGVPVHPAGRYNYNTVLGIMQSERGPDFMPYPCNRLDRLTSGIMFVAKTGESAKRLSDQIRSRTVRKEYVARVVGRFPDGDVVCEQPILRISPKLGLNRVRANGSEARTVFRRLAYYNPKGSQCSAGEQPGKTGYSIVRCFPVTGRTHQLRVHLQFLGHPIVNDPIYANRQVWGFELGQGDADASRNSDDDIISRLNRMGKDQVAEAVAYYDEMIGDYEQKVAEKLSGELCEVCDTPLYTDPGQHELVLWLHSLRYEDMQGTWSYSTPLPSWALPPDGMDGPTEVEPVEIDLGLPEAVPDPAVSPQMAVAEAIA